MYYYTLIHQKNLDNKNRWFAKKKVKETGKIRYFASILLFAVSNLSTSINSPPVTRTALAEICAICICNCCGLKFKFLLFKRYHALFDCISEECEFDSRLEIVIIYLLAWRFSLHYSIYISFSNTVCCVVELNMII